MPKNQRLHDMINERRAELGLTWEALADAAGVSKQTAISIANGRPGHLRNQRALERALQWGNGSISVVGQGGTPELLEEQMDIEAWQPELRSDHERELWSALCGLRAWTRDERLAVLDAHRLTSQIRPTGTDR